MNDEPNSTSTLNCLDAHQTDAEFKRQVECNRILAITKAKGFPRLKALGASMGGIEKIIHTQPSKKPEDVLERYLKAVELDKSGKTTAEISQIMGVTPESVRNMFHRRNYKKVTTKRVKAAIDVDHVVRMVNNEGWRIRTLATKMGVYHSAISYALKKAGYWYDAEKVQIVKLNTK